MSSGRNPEDNPFLQRLAAARSDEGHVKHDPHTVSFPLPPIPLKQRCITDYIIAETRVSKSCHQVNQLKKARPKDSLQAHTYFFKQNKTNIIDPFMYEMESAICAFYHFIAPQIAPTARAIYNQNQETIGTLSKKLEGFKTILEDPLTAEDLSCDKLDLLGIEHFENLDNRVNQEQLDLDTLPDSHVLYSFILPSIENTSTHASLATTRTHREIDVTVKDLRSYRIVKGLSIGMVCSYVFADDDCHRENISKKGKRVDFDMSFWMFLHHFKKSGPVDLKLRDPLNRFAINKNDILRLPFLQHAKPFYWPGKPVKYIPDVFLTSFPTNEFAPKDNELFQQLETHPVFIHYKYVTFLKLILTQEDHYRRIASLHIHQELTYQEQPLIDLLSACAADRIAQCREQLAQLPQFKHWFRIYGAHVYEIIRKEFAEHNAIYLKKMEKKPLYQSQLIDLEEMDRQFQVIFTQMGLSHLTQEMPSVSSSCPT